MKNILAASIPGLIFIFGLGVSLFFALKYKKGSFKINSEGIEDNYDYSTFIKWSDVESIESSGYMIVVYLFNPEDYINNSRGRTQRNMKFNYDQVGSPIAYASLFEDFLFAEKSLLNAFSRYKKK